MPRLRWLCPGPRRGSPGHPSAESPGPSGHEQTWVQEWPASALRSEGVWCPDTCSGEDRSSVGREGRGAVRTTDGPGGDPGQPGRPPLVTTAGSAEAARARVARCCSCWGPGGDDASRPSTRHTKPQGRRKTSSGNQNRTERGPGHRHSPNGQCTEPDPAVCPGDARVS